MWPTSSVTGISRRYWQSAGFKLTTQLSIAGSWNMPISWKPHSVMARSVLSLVRGEYIKVKGRWFYLYRAVDKFGDTIDFMLTEKRNEAAGRNFFNKAIERHGLPEKVVIDKSGSNAAALDTLNWQIWFAGIIGGFIEVLQVKYLNNIVEQSHRAVKLKMLAICRFWSHFTP